MPRGCLYKQIFQAKVDGCEKIKYNERDFGGFVMSKIVVCGLVNMETSVSVEDFPLEYRPIDYRFFGISSTPSGVGLNLSASFSSLSDEVLLLSFCGEDPAGRLIKSEVESLGVSSQYILSKNKSTAQSVVLYDKSGRRSVICDLSDNQELSYDEKLFAKASAGADVICLTNINFSVSLFEAAKASGALIATDVHCLSDIYDEYNSRFMRVADILFLSNENIIGREEEFSSELMREYNPKIIVVGMGSKGALLRVRGEKKPLFQEAIFTRDVVNTVGAGDSLFSSFLHFYAKGRSAEESLKLATVFASWKIGESGGAKGFLSEDELLSLARNKGMI